MICKLLYGPLGRSVEVTKKDFQVLEPEVYLNDIMILFYLRFLQYNVIDKTLCDKVHIFDPQFYTKLSEEPKKTGFSLNKPSKGEGYKSYSVATGYQSVRRWVKKVDIFTKDYLLVPIC